jgi:transposase
VLADQDHVFFEFQAKHNSAAVCEMFRGFSGYIQADAHAIYDAVFRGEARARDDDEPPLEVGCWSHCRRKAWEAAVVAKDPVAREALLHMRKLFELEAEWAHLAPTQRHARRQLVSRPLVDDFFVWAATQYARVKATRALVATAFGYAVRQQTALRRFLDDGRLPMTNNHSERALRGIAVGRRSWLFFGSDDHASAAANLFSLIA